MTARSIEPPSPRSRPTHGALILMYALSGFGKTTQLCYVAHGLAHRGQAKIAAPPNAIESFESTTGLEFPRSAVRDFQFVEDVTAFTKESRGKVTLIGHDDVSPMFEASYGRYDAQALEAATKANKNKDAFYAAGQVLVATKALLAAARNSGTHVVMTGLMQSKSVAKNPATGMDEPIRGGVQMPNKKLVEKVTSVMDAAFRIVKDPSLKSEWKGVLSHKKLDMDWATKDRLFDLGSEKLPMNLGELLRFRSYPIPRLKDPKDDAVVEEIVQALATECWTTGKDKDVVGENAESLISGFGEPIASWIMYDARSRVDIWRLVQPIDAAAAFRKRWGY